MKPDIENTTEPNQRSHRLRTAVIVFLVLMVLYPLSFGPVSWFMFRYNPSGDPIEDTRAVEINIIGPYKPLAAALGLLPEPVQQAYGKYLAWWVAL